MWRKLCHELIGCGCCEVPSACRHALLSKLLGQQHLQLSSRMRDRSTSEQANCWPKDTNSSPSGTPSNADAALESRAS